MKISKNRNSSDSVPTHDRRRGCNLWNSLIPAGKYHKLSTTTHSPEHDLLQFRFRCVFNFCNSIHKFVRKHFESSTATTTRSDSSSTNPNIIIERTLPTLPFDLITEILSRLPVKLLLQLRCVCKSWNSLISNDPNFARKHLTHSTTHSIYSLGFTDPGRLTIYQPEFFLDTTVSTKVKRLPYDSCTIVNVKLLPPYDSYNCYKGREIVGSCNGILCLAFQESILLWNPSIRKINQLPLLPHYDYRMELYISYGFGYHSVTDSYKVVVVFKNICGHFYEVKVNTLGTKVWKNIEDFPFGTVPDHKSGIYLSGTIHWLVFSRHCSTPPHFIVSLDLGNESYQKLLLPPDYAEDKAQKALTLNVLRDCLCIISGHEHDVWLMKEYGKKESWTKLFTISYQQDPSLSYFLNKVVYVFEDGQVLLQCKMPYFRMQLIVYDPRIGTFEFVSLKKSFYDSRVHDLDVSKYGGPQVCIESLISPSS